MLRQLTDVVVGRVAQSFPAVFFVTSGLFTATEHGKAPLPIPTAKLQGSPRDEILEVPLPGCYINDFCHGYES
jgi:hypothetical protein